MKEDSDPIKLSQNTVEAAAPPFRRKMSGAYHLKPWQVWRRAGRLQDGWVGGGSRALDCKDVHSRRVRHPPPPTTARADDSGIFTMPGMPG